MYCNRCGVQLPEGAQFCPNCQGLIAAPAAPDRQPRVAKHLTLLAALWFALGALRMLAALGLFGMGSVLLPFIERQEGPIPAPVHAIIGGIGLLVGLTAVLSLAVGWGLYKRATWGRVLALVMAFVSLLSIPIGTALGIYTLIVLLPSQAEEEWKRVTNRS